MPLVHLPAQRKALGIALRERGSRSSGLREATLHSPALFAKRIVLVKRSDGGQLPRGGQQYPDVKGLQPAPIRRPAMRLDMAVFAWEHMMHEQAAYH